jgi:uncharacterized membrane-anchored protein
MAYGMILVIGLGIIALFLIIWLFIRWRKRKKQKKIMETEVLSDFELAENLMVQSGNRIQPHEILWAIAKSRRKSANINQIPENPQDFNTRLNIERRFENERQNNNLSGTARRTDLTRGSGSIAGSENAALSKLRSEFDRRQSIPSVSTSVNGRNQTGNSQVRRNSRKSLFGRR